MDEILIYCGNDYITGCYFIYERKKWLVLDKIIKTGCIDVDIDIIENPEKINAFKLLFGKYHECYKDKTFSMLESLGEIINTFRNKYVVYYADAKFAEEFDHVKISKKLPEDFFKKLNLDLEKLKVNYPIEFAALAEYSGLYVRKFKGLWDDH